MILTTSKHFDVASMTLPRLYQILSNYTFSSNSIFTLKFCCVGHSEIQRLFFLCKPTKMPDSNMHDEVDQLSKALKNARKQLSSFHVVHVTGGVLNDPSKQNNHLKLQLKALKAELAVNDYCTENGIPPPRLEAVLSIRERNDVTSEITRLSKGIKRYIS